MTHPTILIGTTKGAFLLSHADGWQVSGPHCGGWGINHVVGDAETGHIWAGGGGDWFGAGIWRSTDRGATWSLAKLSNGQMDEWAAGDPDMAAMFDWTPTETPFDGQVTSIWSLHHAHGRLYAGGNPANLYVSTDNGETWTQSESLASFPDREQWAPGAAGLVLHSIVSHDDPAKLWLGISAAGVFATEDGGESWARRNRISNADACDHHHHPAAPSGGEIGHCVHNIARAEGDLLYQQNHHGTYRSPDGGRVWHDISHGLPSSFGFPIAVHPRDPETLWTIPLNGDIDGRFPPGARAAVWKSTDGGQSWSDKRAGLPQQGCFFTVLRQAMAVHGDATLGFGTNTGSIFLSHDEGETWDEVTRHLPTILSVEMM
ncbi:MAG: exo-alpha-sialidase [Alterinioella nitratireducens]|uniref:exo-alpha-sialidase n=1 Tax=Alterinioella nitratireducens TaxID=2735915 RepID=UPI004059B49E